MSKVWCKIFFKKKLCQPNRAGETGKFWSRRTEKLYVTVWCVRARKRPFGVSCYIIFQNSWYLFNIQYRFALKIAYLNSNESLYKRQDISGCGKIRTFSFPHLSPNRGENVFHAYYYHSFRLYSKGRLVSSSYTYLKIKSKILLQT